MQQPKVWCTNGVIMGLAGTLRAMDVFRTLDVPEYDGSDAHSWIVVKLVPLLMAASEQFKLLDEDGCCMEANVLVVVDGQAFTVGKSFSVYSSEEGLYTIGSGGDYAIGALKAGADVLEALTIAASVDPGTGGTLTVSKASELIKHGS